MSGITVRNLVKRWGSVCAVDNVSFETGSCEFVALLGPSGCGKSTTLRLIAGLELATSGTVSIAGRDVTSLPSSQRNLSMVFQSYALFPHMTVAENIVFGLSVRGVPKAECQQRLARIVDLLGSVRAARPSPQPDVGGAAATRRARARTDRRNAGLPARRAALQSGRQVAGRDAQRNPLPAASSPHRHGVRDARPDGGHEHGRPHHPDARRPDGAKRYADGAL